MTADVVVVGGGLSGLAVALRLALNGANVSLIEQSTKLGGRTYSYLDPTTNDIVDNGQHVLVGAYHQTLKYLELIGTRHLLHTEERLRLIFHHPSKGFAKFELPKIPRPFNIAAGVLMYDLMGMRDVRKMLSLGLELKSWNHRFTQQLAGLTVDDWLINAGQSEETRRCFWHPLAVSIMNELPEKAAALLFARSLRNTFFGSKDDATLLIPTVGQTELYVTRAVDLLRQKGCKIILNTEVECVLAEGDRATGVRTKSGDRIGSKAVVCAVPHHVLGDILPDTLRAFPPYGVLKSWTYSPIVSIHLWFDRPIMDHQYVGLIGKKLQWVFNRHRMMSIGNADGTYISAVISAAYDQVDMRKEDIVQMAVEELRDVYPASMKANLLHSVVIKEKRATVSPTPEFDRQRPGHMTPILNLYLAGDWTATGLPPTIEGAVLSGFRCAEEAARIV